MQRRLALSYAAIFCVTLLLLGPVLYLSFSSQMASAFDKALRLAAQRHAALALIPTGFTVGLSNKPFNTSLSGAAEYLLRVTQPHGAPAQ